MLMRVPVEPSFPEGMSFSALRCFRRNRDLLVGTTLTNQGAGDLARGIYRLVSRTFATALNLVPWFSFLASTIG